MTVIEAHRALERAKMALREHTAIEESDRDDAWEITREERERAIDAAFKEFEAASEEQPTPVEDQPDAEGRELRANLRSAEFHRFAAFALGMQPDGVEAELQKHYGLDSNMFPLAMLREERVDVSTGIPANAESGVLGQSQGPILMPVFHDGDTEWLQVRMPTVGLGDRAYPVLTTRPTVGGPHKDATRVDAAEQTFTSKLLEPARFTTAVHFQKLDELRFSGMREALRSAMSMGLGEQFDAKVVGAIVAGGTQSDKTGSDASWRSARRNLVSAFIDGRFATETRALRHFLGRESFAALMDLFRNNSVDYRSGIDDLQLLTGTMPRVSAHAPAYTANTRKQKVIVRVGSRADAVAPMWQGVEMIVDRISDAQEGGIRITGVMFGNYDVVRAQGFQVVDMKWAA